MAKTIEEKAEKGNYICAGCKTEFTGTVCPDCGNKNGNMKLAADGIEQGLHKSSYLFQGRQLKAVDDSMYDGRLLEQKRAAMQMEEMDDNLREAYVLKSNIKLHDLKMQQRKKEIEAKNLEEQSKDFISGRTNIPPQQQGQQGLDQQIPQMPFMSTMTPQAIFMQQLMRMDSKKRAEFIEQLSDADPSALSNLSSMFAQAQPQQQQQMNPMMPPWMQQGNAMMPPWMMQPPPQPQQPAADPIALVTAIFELSQKMQPQRDDSVRESLQEFKQSIQKVHDRIDTVVSKERERDSSPILDKLNLLEQKVNSGGGQKSIVDQVTELTMLVDGLEKAGLVKRAGSSDKTVDDELKIKEFDFKKETKQQEIKIEEAKIEAERSKSDLTKGIISSLFQRGIQKGIQAREDENPTRPQTSPRSSLRPQTINRVQTAHQPDPVEIISEMSTEAGIVRETRRPVKKQED